MVIFLRWLIIINVVGEARKIEEEFRLCKSYHMHKNTNQNLISSEKLTEFFKDHLKDKTVELQPEVLNPELFPHILPPKILKLTLISHLNQK